MYTVNMWYFMIPCTYSDLQFASTTIWPSPYCNVPELSEAQGFTPLHLLKAKVYWTSTESLQCNHMSIGRDKINDLHYCNYSSINTGPNTENTEWISVYKAWVLVIYVAMLQYFTDTLVVYRLSIKVCTWNLDVYGWKCIH